MKPPLTGSQNFRAVAPLLNGHYERLLAIAILRGRGRDADAAVAEVVAERDFVATALTDAEETLKRQTLDARRSSPRSRA